MVQSTASGSAQRSRRRWSFADCSFDEANWALMVKGERVRIESKPLEVLRALLLHAGSVVSKSELLDAIWGDVTVVEASLPTAVRKLRVAIQDGTDGRHFIETAAGIGYRFAAPVELSDTGAGPRSAIRAGPGTSVLRNLAGLARSLARSGSAAAWTAVAVVLLVLSLRLGPELFPSKTTRTFTSREVVNVLRRLDVEEAEKMIAAGWRADAPLDAQGDTPLGFAVEICEWDPGHDRRRLLLMARTLLDGGARIDQRNAYGDTAYSIAKAKRFCGPDHPVTELFRRLCSAGSSPLGDRCMAAYELARNQHFVAMAEAR